MAFAARTRRRFLVWGCVGVALCLGLCLLAARSPETLARWDQLVQMGPAWWRPSAPWLERPLVWVSYAFGTLASMIATAIVAGLLLAGGRRRAALYVVLVIVVTAVSTTVLKLVVDMPRPVVEDPVLQFSSSAMPSGHASNIAAAATAASVLAYVFIRRDRSRALVLGASVLVSLVVGLDRLMLGAHTLTEVVAGYALGLGIGLLTASLTASSGSR